MTDRKQDELDIQPVDVLSLLTKSGIASIPIIGPLFADLVTIAIPNQRMDRIADTLRMIIGKVDDIQRIIEKFKTPEGIDLIEDAMLQAGRALTEERREYIANLLRNSLTKEEIIHDQKKKLFKILDQLTDTEIIFLKYYSMSVGRNRDHPFYLQHREVLEPVEKELASERIDDKSKAFIDNYSNTLDRLGLVNMETARVENRRPIGTTALGRLLLDYIEVPDE